MSLTSPGAVSDNVQPTLLKRVGLQIPRCMLSRQVGGSAVRLVLAGTPVAAFRVRRNYGRLRLTPRDVSTYLLSRNFGPKSHSQALSSHFRTLLSHYNYTTEDKPIQDTTAWYTQLTS